jgi:hypothetical protein
MAAATIAVTATTHSTLAVTSTYLNIINITVF